MCARAQAACLPVGPSICVLRAPLQSRLWSDIEAPGLLFNEAEVRRIIPKSRLGCTSAAVTAVILWRGRCRPERNLPFGTHVVETGLVTFDDRW